MKSLLLSECPFMHTLYNEGLGSLIQKGYFQETSASVFRHIIPKDRQSSKVSISNITSIIKSHNPQYLVSTVLFSAQNHCFIDSLTRVYHTIHYNIALFLSIFNIITKIHLYQSTHPYVSLGLHIKDIYIYKYITYRYMNRLYSYLSYKPLNMQKECFIQCGLVL